jgi:hypothetical protein
MRGKLVLTFLAGLVVGLVIMLAGWHPQALGQRQANAPQWEYKVVTLLYQSDDERMTKQLNQLADDGWEYVGLVSTAATAVPNRSNHEASVAFRRPKK